jgi:DNA repair protein RadC
MVVRYRPYRLPLPVEGRAQTPREAAGLASAILGNTTVEQVLVLHLDTKRSLIGVHVVSQGTLDAALVHPREVFKVALLANAASVILAHNHPSGDPTPSEEDLVLTKRLAACGVLLGVAVTDHIVIGQDGAYCSLQETGRL